MNPYLKNLHKIEFVVTDACTGRCKHCSAGDHVSSGERIDPKVAADAVQRIAAAYDVKTVMAFGGEPLLYTDAVFEIMAAATAARVAKRQVITNGYFTKGSAQMRAVAKELAACGTNELLLSVDAFHQETIPLNAVRAFAAEAKSFGIPVFLQPAWLVSATDRNPYNQKTREILDSFADLGLRENAGNIVFPEGNALKFLSAYFKNGAPENPYVEDPFDVRCVSFSANGDVLDGNVYRRDIMDILENYRPAEV